MRIFHDGLTDFKVVARGKVFDPFYNDEVYVFKVTEFHYYVSLMRWEIRAFLFSQSGGFVAMAYCVSGKTLFFLDAKYPEPKKKQLLEFFQAKAR